MVLGTFFFSLMAVGIKYASQSFGTLEILFYRGLVATVFMGVVLAVRRIDWRTPVPLLHVSRSAAGVFAMGTWFYAIAHLPLATAMTLNYTSSVWIAAFIVGGALLYGNAPQRQGPLLAAVLMGFVGVLMALRPTIDHTQLFAGLVGMMSGMGAALAYMQVTALGKAGEPEERVVFYFSIGTTLVGLVGMLGSGITAWSEVRTSDAAWLLPIGVLATLGQWSLTRAYRKGATLVVANLQYSGIVFSALYGLFLFGDQIPPIGWAGMALIIICGIAATALRNRTLIQAPAEEH